jgi:hypothetical protein
VVIIIIIFSCCSLERRFMLHWMMR